MIYQDVGRLIELLSLVDNFQEKENTKCNQRHYLYLHSVSLPLSKANELDQEYVL